MKALIFDFDGLIVDTETAIYQAWRELYQDHGHDLPLQAYVQCVGSTFHSYDPMAELEALLGKKVNWDAALPKKEARIVELQQNQGPMPGVVDLLEEARSSDLPCVVASSSDLSWVHGWLKRLGLFGYFLDICCRDHVQRAKPAPDLFLLAARRAGISPHEGLVLEDSANGLRAAVAANIPCVIVPNMITEGSDFRAAAAVLPSLEGVGLEKLRELASTNGRQSPSTYH